MNREQTNVIIRMCAGVYPHTDVTEDMIDLWTNAFYDNDAALVRDAVDEWILTNEWWPTIAGIRQIMRATATGRRAIAPRGAHCDGTGWIENTERASTPCPQCNPALYGVWSDPAKLRGYRNGISLSELSDDVTSTGGQQNYLGAWPNSCLQTEMEDPDDPIVHPQRGKQIAAEAYAAECLSEGREPNWSWFEGAIGGLR